MCLAAGLARDAERSNASFTSLSLARSRLVAVFRFTMNPLLSADLPTDVGESQEREGLRLAFPTLLSVLGGEPPEFDQSRLVGVQGQAELLQAFPSSRRNRSAS